MKSAPARTFAGTGDLGLPRATGTTRITMSGRTSAAGPSYSPGGGIPAHIAGPGAVVQSALDASLALRRPGASIRSRCHGCSLQELPDFPVREVAVVVVHDVVIRGGTVVDGTGAPRRTADVALSGGRITEI